MFSTDVLKIVSFATSPLLGFQLALGSGKGRYFRVAREQGDGVYCYIDVWGESNWPERVQERQSYMFRRLYIFKEQCSFPLHLFDIKRDLSSQT